MLEASWSEPEASARLTLPFESTAFSRSNKKSREPENLVDADSLTLKALRLVFVLNFAQTGWGTNNDVED
jgi:hypothetical protein